MNVWKDFNKDRISPEEFVAYIEIEAGSKNKYELDKETGLMCIEYDDGRILYSPYVLEGLIKGKIVVVKLPWEPKEGDKYYAPSLPTKSICVEIWHNETCDYSLKALGMVYRTCEEAEANFPNDYERLTGKQLSSVE